MDEGRQARHQHHYRCDRRTSPERRNRTSSETLTLLDEVRYDASVFVQVFARPNTPALNLEDAIPDEEKSHRLESLHLEAARYPDRQKQEIYRKQLRSNG